MAIDRPSTLRNIDFAIVVISLAVIGTALGCLVFIAANQATATEDPDLRRSLARLAWIALTMLLFVVVVFIWLLARRVFGRLREQRRRAEPTPYLDAWTLAGQRFKLSAEQERELDELDIDALRSDDDSKPPDESSPPDSDDDNPDTPDKPRPTWR